jgi:hypothetical protein
MIPQRNLLRDVVREYSHARQTWEQAQARGDSDRADAAFSKMQLIEDCIALHERSREWRG